MPIYEYKCTECGEHFEKLQKSTDEALKVCENCGGGLEKQWSLSGFQFKGEGWYVTDYAKDKNPKATPKTEKSAEAKSTNAPDAASKGSTDTKKETVTKKD